MVPRPFHTDGAVSRRQLIVTTGAFLTGGGVVAATASEPASGAVSTTSLNIPPAKYEGEDGSVVDLLLELVGQYEYEADAADTLKLSLEVAPEDTSDPDYQQIDHVEEPLAAASGAGQFTLGGSLLDHDQLSAEGFSADPQTTVVRNLPIRVVMDVRADGGSVVRSMSQTVAHVEVTNTGVQASAAVVGEGEIAIEV